VENTEIYVMCIANEQHMSTNNKTFLPWTPLGASGILKNYVKIFVEPHVFVFVVFHVFKTSAFQRLYSHDQYE